MSDPIVDEVRHWRMQHTNKFGGDLKKIIEDFRRIQRTSDCRVVRRSPKLLPAIRAEEKRALEERVSEQ